MVHKMRKGTKSCRECRRRKTRCIFPSGQEICKECNYHGRRCVDQSQALLSGEAEVVDNRPNLRVRVARLETMLERLVQCDSKAAAEALNGLNLPRDFAKSPISLPCRSSRDGALGERVRDNDTCTESPLSSLFDNETLKRNEDFSPLQHSGSYDPEDRHGKARHELLSRISLEPNILRVLEVAGSWWLPWRNLWPSLTEGDEQLSLVEFVHFHLAQEGLVDIALGLICIAISLQQVRPGAEGNVIPLSAPSDELAKGLLTDVDQLALADDDGLASIEGLEALVLRAKSYVNASNQPRKSWLSIRRAISVAQLIDLPRASQDQPSVEVTRRQGFMGALFETDRFMSLLMGLPYAVDDNFTGEVAKPVLHSTADICTRMRALRRVVAFVAGRVNDRNASNPDGNVSTMEVAQKTLDDAWRTLPEDWWNVETHSDDSNNPQSSHEHILTQLWFYQVQSFLHLPYMLKPANDARYEKSGVICLSSSRKLLRVYHALRQPHLAPYSSKCADFQALIAAILVLLGLLQQGSQEWNGAPDRYEEDVGLINATRQAFELSSMEQGGSIAWQGVYMIDLLGVFVANGRRSDFIRTATLFVPYLGTISVRSGRDRSTARTSPEGAVSFAQSETSFSSQIFSSHEQQQQQQHVIVPDTNLLTSRKSSTAYPLAERQGVATAEQSCLPSFPMPDGSFALGSMPVPADDFLSVSLPTTAMRKASLPATLSVPLPPPPFEPFRSDFDTASNANMVVKANNERGNYVDVDLDWQRLMVGTELELEQAWKRSCGNGFGIDAGLVGTNQAGMALY